MTDHIIHLIIRALYKKDFNAVKKLIEVLEEDGNEERNSEYKEDTHLRE
jgi:hypothetical protein